MSWEAAFDELEKALLQKKAEQEAVVDSLQATTNQDAVYWPKGTGYGYDGNSDAWDASALVQLLADKVQAKEKALYAITPVLETCTSEELPQAIAQIVPLLTNCLSSQSILQMEAEKPVAVALLSLCERVLRLQRPLGPESSTYALWTLIQRMKKQTDLLLAKEMREEAKNEAGQSVSSLIVKLCEDIHAILPVLPPTIQMPTETPTLEKAKSTEEKMEGVRYVKLMAPHLFKEISEFGTHKYMKAKENPTKLAPKWVRRVASEYADLAQSLPINIESSVFMRVCESHLAYSQMLIVGPEGTPYSGGLFLFDVSLPNTYPNQPPQVNLQTTGHGSVRFNPNLYNCGKVCLSLLGTWQGGAAENWDPAISTLLQLAVSIQSLIFVPHPYFNEPSYESSYNTEEGMQASSNYNVVIKRATVQWAMIDMLKNPPKGFEEVVSLHFKLRRDFILKQCQDWAVEKQQLDELTSLLEEVCKR